jgi:hypothetical protein
LILKHRNIISEQLIILKDSWVSPAFILVLPLFRKRLTLLRFSGEGGLRFLSRQVLADSKPNWIIRGVMRSVIGIVAKFFWRSWPIGTRAGNRTGTWAGTKVRKLDLGGQAGAHTSAGRSGQVIQV